MHRRHRRERRGGSRQLTLSILTFLPSDLSELSLSRLFAPNFRSIRDKRIVKAADEVPDRQRARLSPAIRARDIPDNLPRTPRRSLPTLNRSPNRLEATAPILAVHARPARRRCLPSFPPPFSLRLFHLPYDRIRSIRFARRAYKRGQETMARGPPSPSPPRRTRALLFPSLPFSLRMRSMLTFRSPRCRVVDTVPNAGGASRHDADTSPG